MVEGMRVRRRPEPASDRVWARLTPRAGVPAHDSEKETQTETDTAGATEPKPEAGLASGLEADWLPARPSRGEGDPRPRRLRVEVPSRFRTGEWIPSRRAALGLLAAVAVAAIVFGVRWALAVVGDPPDLIRPASTASGAVTSGATGSSAAGDRGTGHTTGHGTAAPSTRPTGDPPGGTGVVAGQGQVVVDVVGRVATPGLVRLPAGSRVADAITAAGGPAGEADLQALNQARLLVDGEQIRVPSPGEVLASAGGAAAPGQPGAVSGGVGGPSTFGGGLVSLNAADVAALDGLPGVGPVLAQRILDWRTQHGRFTSIDELGEVSGIGDKLLGQLRPLVTL